MAIYIITGAPGSGKSFYIVKHIRDTYCKFNRTLSRWEARKHEENGFEYTLITNLEGFLLPHLDLDEVIEKSKKDKYQFFTEPFQRLVAEKYRNLVYVIDECQKYFDERVNKMTDVLYFFEYHRHLGMDIFLMAQTYERIARNIRGLEEKQIHAVRRSMSVVGEFQYNIISGSEIVDKKILKKDNSIFKLYKSRERKEISKIKNPIIKYILIAIGVLCISLFAFFKTFIGNTKGNINNSIESAKQVKESIKNKKGEIIEREGGKIGRDSEESEKVYYTRLSYVRSEKEILIMNYAQNELIPIEYVQGNKMIEERKGFLRIWMVSNERMSEYEKPINKGEDEKSQGGNVEGEKGM